jgi:hypothetical protein
MAMMDVGRVRMCMCEPRVLVPMSVRLVWRVLGRVGVLVMFVVIVKVLVLHWLMDVPMFMAFRKRAARRLST